MNPITQAALDRPRRHTPAPAPAPTPAYSTETAIRHMPIPVLVVHGPINEYMRQQARKEATDPILAMHRTLAATNGVALVVDHLKRTAVDRPGSHIAGYLDVIRLLEQNCLNISHHFCHTLINCVFEVRYGRPKSIYKMAGLKI